MFQEKNGYIVESVNEKNVILGFKLKDRFLSRIGNCIKFENGDEYWIECPSSTSQPLLLFPWSESVQKVLFMSPIELNSIFSKSNAEITREKKLDIQ